MQRAPSPTHMAIVLTTSAIALGDPPLPYKKYWKRCLVPSNPILLVYLASLLVTTFLFVAAVSNSGDHYASDQLSPNDNGVGFYS